MSILQYTKKSYNKNLPRNNSQKNSIICIEDSHPYIAGIVKKVQNIGYLLLVTSNIPLGGGGVVLVKYKSNIRINCISIISIKTDTTPLILIFLAVNILQVIYISKLGLVLLFLNFYHCNLLSFQFEDNQITHFKVRIFW